MLPSWCRITAHAVVWQISAHSTAASTHPVRPDPPMSLPPDRQESTRALQSRAASLQAIAHRANTSSLGNPGSVTGITSGSSITFTLITFLNCVHKGAPELPTAETVGRKPAVTDK